jgi:poly-gamma-glutamate synthase PgsB/CapB
MTIFLLTATGIYFYIVWLLLSYQWFKRERDQIPFRVHVNGIRGKSTVTRYVSAVCREADYHTFGKTTGSAARILRPDGEDYDFHRRGYPNVNEQVKMVKQFARQKAEAIVLECMAVNPLYAKWLEDKVTQAHVNIITNVRYDHPDQMGNTLEQIAESLSSTIPENGILITTEYNPKLLGILAKKARQKNTTVIVANANQVASKDLEGFTHFAHEENIAIGYEIAKLLKLPKERALAAMQSAVADPGAFEIEYFEFEGRVIAWANLFAINDRESFISVSLKLFQQLSSYERVVILNNRPDRPERVELFALLAQQLAFNHVVTFGAYEAKVKQLFANQSDQILNLGVSSKFKGASAEQLLRQICQRAASNKILLIGAVNIHTEQAEKILHFFEEERKKGRRLTDRQGSQSEPASAFK